MDLATELREFHRIFQGYTGDVAKALSRRERMARKAALGDTPESLTYGEIDFSSLAEFLIWVRIYEYRLVGIEISKPLSSCETMIREALTKDQEVLLSIVARVWAKPWSPQASRFQICSMSCGALRS